MLTQFKLLSYIIFLFLIFTNIFADIFFLNGQNNIINAKANISYKLKIKEPLKKIKIKLFKFQTFTNGINKQIISQYHFKFLPKPDIITKKIDSLGNSYIEIFYHNLNKNLIITSNFRYDHELELYPINNLYEYPLNSSAIKYISIFLKENELTQKNIPKLQKVINILKKSITTEFQMIIKIFNWVHSNITFSDNSIHKDARNTFFFKSGNRQGILNLLLSMLRMSNIPCRIANGFINHKTIDFNVSFNKKWPVFFEKNSFVKLKFPKSIGQWIEIYFPDRNWVAFDPFLSYFFVPTNFIKQHISLESKLNKMLPNNKNAIPEIKFFIESTENNNIKTTHISKNKKMQFLSPIFNSKIKNWLIKFFKKKIKSIYNNDAIYNNIIIENKLFIELKPPTLRFDQNYRQIDLKVSPELFYGQLIHIRKNIFLSEIELPLFRFKIIPKGNIWLEIYPHNFSKNSSKIIKSNYSDIKNINSTKQYQWTKFYFNKKIKKGKYWIILKHNHKEILLWRGVFGNLFFKEYDSLSINKKLRNATWLYLDLSFRLEGLLQEKA